MTTGGKLYAVDVISMWNVHHSAVPEPLILSAIVELRRQINNSFITHVFTN